jgi:predicted choloylglycine hydrolase
LQEGEAARPSYLACRRALSDHMPELLPLWEKLSALGGGEDKLARLLSGYRPPPFVFGCSQALWTRGEPALVRNYDYHPEACEGILWRSRWLGTRVLAMSDLLWGVLDGMNEHGVALALSFGGSQALGDGFGIPVILRYALEACRNTAEVQELLARVPSHMSYTVSAIDRQGDWATVFMGPDRPTTMASSPVATNHQEEVRWPEHAELSHTVERAMAIRSALDDPKTTLEGLVKAFTKPPIARRDYARGVGTLYTAVYRPVSGSLELRWSRRRWPFSFERFEERETVVVY